MGEHDYNAGMAGRPWSPDMNRTDYEAGKSVYDAKQGILGAGSGPKTEISGPGFVGLVMAPLLAIMYPVAGVITSAGLLAGYFGTPFLTGNLTGVRVLLVIAVAIGALWLGLKLEHKASESRIYRNLRHPFRLLVVGIIPLAYQMGVGRKETFQAPAGTLAVGLCLILLMHWLFPKFDRVFFPVMDSKAKAEAIKYAGMDDEQIFAIKNRKFHGILKFTAAWLVGSIGLMYLLPHVSVALLVAGVFLVCWTLRNRLFFKKETSGTAT